MADLTLPMLEAATHRAENTVAGITQLAKVIGLELIDIYLEQADQPDDLTAEQLGEIAGSLIGIAGLSIDLLKDIAPLTGLNINVSGGMPSLVDGSEELVDAPLQADVSSQVPEILEEPIEVEPEDPDLDSEQTPS